MESDRESDSPISLKLLFDRLNSVESRKEQKFSNLHSQIAQLTYEFKEEINGVKHSLKEFEIPSTALVPSSKIFSKSPKPLKIPRVPTKRCWMSKHQKYYG